MSDSAIQSAFVRARRRRKNHVLGNSNKAFRCRYRDATTQSRIGDDSANSGFDALWQKEDGLPELNEALRSGLPRKAGRFLAS